MRCGAQDIALVRAISAAFIEDGAIVETATLGERRAGEGVTDHTHFDSASLAKPVYAVAILALVDEGALDLDRPLQSYMPLFDDAASHAITARHVLSHSTGLPNWHYGDAPRPMLFASETRWGYSGEAFFLLQRVVEHITGKALSPLVDEYVLRPAGMARSSMVWNDAVAADNAWPHDGFGDLIDNRFITQRISMVRAERARQTDKPLAQWTTDDALAACAANNEQSVPGTRSLIPHSVFGPQPRTLRAS